MQTGGRWEWKFKKNGSETKQGVARLLGKCENYFERRRLQNYSQTLHFSSSYPGWSYLLVSEDLKNCRNRHLTLLALLAFGTNWYFLSEGFSLQFFWRLKRLAITAIKVQEETTSILFAISLSHYTQYALQCKLVFFAIQIQDILNYAFESWVGVCICICIWEWVGVWEFEWVVPRSVRALPSRRRLPSDPTSGWDR